MAVSRASEIGKRVRVARISELASIMIGGADKAKRWLRSPSMFLGGQTPLAMIATDDGARLVEQSLYAIGYGSVG
jgi:putative toxin-antitoxin system antitoxin component (TIGR02293 family)